MLIKRKTNVGILMLIQLVVYIFINNFIKKLLFLLLFKISDC